MLALFAIMRLLVPQSSPVRNVLDVLSVGYGIPLASAIACGLHQARALAILVVLVLAVSAPQVSELVRLLVPIGAGLVLGSIGRAMVTEARQ